MAEHSRPIISAVVITYHVIVSVTKAQHCGMASSENDKTLQGHAYKTLKTGNPLDCMLQCVAEIQCQSINYEMISSKCELNNRTKEARLDNFVAKEGNLYIKRWLRRGK